MASNTAYDLPVSRKRKGVIQKLMATSQSSIVGQSHIRDVYERADGDEEKAKELLAGSNIESVDGDITARDKQERDITRVEVLMCKGITDTWAIADISKIPQPKVSKYKKLVRERWYVSNSGKETIERQGALVRSAEISLQTLWKGHQEVERKKALKPDCLKTQNSLHNTQIAYVKEINRVLSLQADLCGVNPKQINLIQQNNYNTGSDIGDKIYDLSPSQELMEFASQLSDKISSDNFPSEKNIDLEASEYELKDG